MRNAPGCWDRAPGSPTEFSVSTEGPDAYNVWDYASRRARRHRSGTSSTCLDWCNLSIILTPRATSSTLRMHPAVGDMVRLSAHVDPHAEKGRGRDVAQPPSCCHTLLPKSFDYLYRMLEIKIGTEKMQTDPEFSFFMGSASPLRFGRDVLEMAMHAIKRGQVVGIGGNCNCGVQIADHRCVQHRHRSCRTACRHVYRHLD